MAENEGPEDTAADAVAPGGRASRGPNPDPGGATDEGDMVPPYDDRSKGRGESDSLKERAESVERQMGGSPSDAGENAEVTRDDDYADESGSHTPGVSRGENLGKKDEAGREHEGADEKTGRPVGTSDPRDSTGVNPQESVTDSATAPSGDQGG